MWRSIWAATRDAGLPISFHIGSGDDVKAAAAPSAPAAAGGAVTQQGNAWLAPAVARWQYFAGAMALARFEYFRVYLWCASPPPRPSIPRTSRTSLTSPIPLHVTLGVNKWANNLPFPVTVLGNWNTSESTVSVSVRLIPTLDAGI